MVYFQHQSGCAIHIARDAGEIPGGVNYVVPPSAYADPSDDAVTADGMRRITLLGRRAPDDDGGGHDPAARGVIRGAMRQDDGAAARHRGWARAPPPPPAAAAAGGPIRAFGSAIHSPSRFVLLGSRFASPYIRPRPPPRTSPGTDLRARAPQLVAVRRQRLGVGRGVARRGRRDGVDPAPQSWAHHRRGGENIRFLQQQTRAHIQIQSEHDMCPGQPERTVYCVARASPAPKRRA